MIVFLDRVILLRDGKRLQQEMYHALHIVESIYKDVVYGHDVELYSALDGYHPGSAKRKSLHPDGFAIDIRLPYSPINYVNHEALNRNIVNKLKRSLGQSYQVILESDHIHIEFDPPYESIDRIRDASSK